MIWDKSNKMEKKKKKGGKPLKKINAGATAGTDDKIWMIKATKKIQKNRQTTTNDRKKRGKKERHTRDWQGGRKGPNQ